MARARHEARRNRARAAGELIMAILIKQDGSQQLVQPANGLVFSQEEILMYGDLGWVLMGTGEEMDRENRPANIKAVRQ
jgi:hypothetical protein